MPLTAAELAERLYGTRSGNGWIARCPAHKDGTPSLSIRDGENGVPIWRCHAGCSQADVLHGAGLNLGDVLPDRENGRHAAPIAHRCGIDEPEEAALIAAYTPPTAAADTSPAARQWWQSGALGRWLPCPFCVNAKAVGAPGGDRPS